MLPAVTAAAQLSHSAFLPFRIRTATLGIHNVRWTCILSHAVHEQEVPIITVRVRPSEALDAPAPASPHAKKSTVCEVHTTKKHKEEVRKANSRIYRGAHCSPIGPSPLHLICAALLLGFRRALIPSYQSAS